MKVAERLREGFTGEKCNRPWCRGDVYLEYDNRRHEWIKTCLLCGRSEVIRKLKEVLR